MVYGSAFIGVVFDFDDTLVPDSTSRLLREHGIDPDRFWQEDAKRLVRSGYDPTLAYLRLLLENIGPCKALGELTLSGLRDFGRAVDAEFFPGVVDLFNDLRKIVTEGRFKDIEINFFIVSSGLEEVIRGSSLVQREFAAVYGSQLAGDEGNSPLKYIRRAVTFTEKTRYLFEINKGLDAEDTATNPYLVNRDVPQDRWRIPFEQMIYVGDGLTDIPCFSLLKAMHGTAFGVFNPGKEASAKQALQEFLKTDRVMSAHAPQVQTGRRTRGSLASGC